MGGGPSHPEGDRKIPEVEWGKQTSFSGRQRKRDFLGNEEEPAPTQVGGVQQALGGCDKL